jgi:menaquinone-dependent protoporphyrinogen oxidase
MTLAQQENAMARVLIVFDTGEGHTEKIASRMSEMAVRAGHSVETYDVGHLPDPLRVDAYDAVLIGGSVHMGKHSPKLEQFVLDHRESLQQVPSAFFSVSLSAAGTDQQQREAQQLLDDFLRRTQWNPIRSQTLAGALLYREYNFIKRWLMRRVMKQTRGEADSSRNYDYTDWRAVNRFVDSFLNELP